MDWLEFVPTYVAQPLGFPFMQRAMIAAIAAGVVCAILSCFLILKGWSLMGDAISHAVLPGIILAHSAGLPIVIGAVGSGMVCALATGYIKDHCRVKEDAVMGIVFSGMFALGLVLFTHIDTELHLNHILFGNVLGITPAELWQMLLIAGAVSLVILLKRRDLMLYCFDPAQAQVQGLPVKTLHYGLLCLLALTIVAALQAVGVLLAIAMLILPGITASLLARRFDGMLLAAVLASVGSCVTGTLISFHIDGATGPCIVIVQALLFVAAHVYRIARPIPPQVA
ncbi:metal ABC transporter permease [Acerihabitans sp. KWT182]|uniref:Metal ABC transporter permease n=1 Tax=Acerihabitans sp. KWT182 TaxID=3157919 RepID=A0AAU7Q7B9_9GAMM